ncbi:MAG: 2-phosphosulfolactate phosphatase [Verrucomicrobiae bacterium]|nr:2-phosphosulfolactate phosphatase [Verrucomicrobiae bacterium]MCX7722897.1 2-phosphosulfolactate phosphatase [Verrucomicrobiae bacterium]MDW7979675.1 2-phosphosulfolactate phosphatase [Verrucomicrobiales bacterium]
MHPRLEVLFTPAEFAGLNQRDLSGTTCVVFDVLRFTSTVVTALANGAAAVVPVPDISRALTLKLAEPDVLLGGERGGLKITAELTGGIEFDLGNSPREYVAERVAGKTIVTTTTNGSRAFNACAGARAVYACAFLNLSATARRLASAPPPELLLVCSGTYEEAALEDAAAAGALCNLLWDHYSPGDVADSAQLARAVWLWLEGDLGRLAELSKNARRLRRLPGLGDDVAFCLRTDVYALVAQLDSRGRIVAS